jgi:hypothetical protein
MFEVSGEIECPYCGEVSWTFVDLSEGNHDYIEDCQVCCRPIEVTLRITDLENGQFNLSTKTSDE